MAAPNIINLSTITGKTAFANVTQASSNVLVNTAASGKVFKINTILAANHNTLTATEVSVSIFRGGIENKLAANIVIPAKASLSIVSRDNQIYMEEGDAIRMSSIDSNKVWATISYEEMS